ncbi:alpha-mannosidase [Proteiniphilum saccharofermentans]|uniref:Alpha-mannosidase n=1 Tax=Proteiniphilum saccharofermentans TaxID=1642647 RepID=A0A1R3SUC5_9BACT|nr:MULTISPECIES: glycoside hydrolase family 38 C-terminal domain-containing protein [Proteiniphilum]MDY9919386.1 glycoside hydrolase family 38 C-terminal domain-containing protein [Proteiniphilum sp.]SCD19913.1 alpha-mannosidase [Proteiniphilum saccharofermentans]
MVLENLSQKHRLSVFILFCFLLVKIPVLSQTAWFTDGYHGGIYGHYPQWQARFMVEQLEKHPDWAINLEIEPETWDTISVTDAENFKAFQAYFEKEGPSGRIEFVNPTWSQPYCYNISGESIIRQFHYGMAKTREYFPSASFVTYAVEEPCFTSSLPQILKGFGYKYAVLRNPNTCWGGYTSAFGKNLVNWIGPDGTSIPAVPRYAVEELSTESTWQTESWTNSNSFIEKCFANGIQFPVGMCFQDAGWDGGPWRSEYQPTRYTTWTNYFEMIKGKVEPEDWHFTQEDIKPGLVWGAQVVQEIAKQVRESENLLVTAEKMAAMDYLFNGKSWPEEDFAEAWRTLMLAQHHDCWIVPYNGRPGDTWADKVVRWTEATNQIASEKISNLFARTNNTEYIRVYNTLGSARKEEVALILPEHFRGRKIVVIDAKGKPVPHQLSESVDGEVTLFFEASVPGMGYATYWLKQSDKELPSKKELDLSSEKLTSSEKLAIETDYYSVIIDPAHGGTITSLIDKKKGNKQLVQNGKYLNDLRGFFYKEDRFYEGSENQATVSVMEEGELFTRVKVENQIAGHNYYQLITFYENNPRIDFTLHIDWDGQPRIGAYDQSDNYEATDRNKAFYNDDYKLHVRFPFSDIGRKIYKNAPFDVTESKLDNTLYSSWDTIKHNVILNWVDITGQEQDYGVALFSDHATSYLQSDSLPLGLTVQYTGRALWGRDYSIHGPTEIRYALLPHSGDWERGEVEKASSQWNEPMVAQFTSGSPEQQERSILETIGDNLEITSMVVENGNLLVRIYNTSSREISREVTWNCSVDKIEQVDLKGDTIRELSPVDKGAGRLQTNITIPQFGFVTLRFIDLQIKE